MVFQIKSYGIRSAVMILFHLIFFIVVCLCEAAAVPGVKGFDEDSIASHSTTHDDMQDSHVTNGVANLSQPFHGGGYMLAASYWPKVKKKNNMHFNEGGFNVRIGTSQSFLCLFISPYRTVL